MTDDITEEWARTAEPGPELDRVCAEFHRPGDDFVRWRCCGGHWRGPWSGASCPVCESEPSESMRDSKRYSTDWSAAGELLEAMDDLEPEDRHAALKLLRRLISQRIEQRTGEPWPLGDAFKVRPVDVARLCAVLVARGITRQDLETTNG